MVINDLVMLLSHSKLSQPEFSASISEQKVVFNSLQHPRRVIMSFLSFFTFRWNLGESPSAPVEWPCSNGLPGSRTFNAWWRSLCVNWFNRPATQLLASSIESIKPLSVCVAHCRCYQDLKKRARWHLAIGKASKTRVTEFVRNGVCVWTMFILQKKHAVLCKIFFEFRPEWGGLGTLPYR